MNLSSSTEIYAHDSTGFGIVGGFFNLGGNVCGISNNHVIANFNNCFKKDAVFLSGGPDANTKVGALQTWVTLDSADVNYLDIALFRVDSTLTTQWMMPDGVDAPAGFDTAIDNQSIYMMRSNNTQRRGQVSTARISDHNIQFGVHGKVFTFTSLIEIQSIDDSPFSIDGQSGSIIFSDAHAILGVLLGASPGGNVSYALPFINDVDGTGILDVYDLSIV